MKTIITIAIIGILSLPATNPVNRISVSLAEDTELPSEKPARFHKKVQIALLLDTSNSMDGLINQAKAQLWDIVNEFTYARCSHDQRPGLEIALYQYGNNGLPSREGYIQQVLGFSGDLDEISQKLFSLTTNGGEEYCGQVIYTSLEQLDWDKDPRNLKLIFIAGNEPFTQGKTDYREAAARARRSDVVVNTIFCGDYHNGIRTEWQKGAQLTGGEYTAINHDHQVVHVPTPYDEIIIKLNRKLNTTYISYGHAGASKMANQSAQDANAMELEEAVAVKRAVSKSSDFYRNSSWDLVDASDDADFDVSHVDREHLPSELRTKSDKELMDHIEKQKSERARIRSEIVDYNQKRREFLAKNQEEQQGGLEKAMLSAIKKQAGKKELKWVEK